MLEVDIHQLLCVKLESNKNHNRVIRSIRKIQIFFVLMAVHKLVLLYASPRSKVLTIINYDYSFMLIGDNSMHNLHWSAVITVCCFAIQVCWFNIPLYFILMISSIIFDRKITHHKIDIVAKNISKLLLKRKLFYFSLVILFYHVPFGKFVLFFFLS